MGDGRCRIVICDDQEPYRRLVSVVLGLEPDLEVVGEAGDGREVVEVVGELQPDIVLLDIAMPVMDGLEALPLIRVSAPDARIVMLTGVTAPSVREQALAAGASRFVEKGADIDDIARHVREVCEEG